MSDTVNSETVMVRDFRCNGCGTPLKIPKNSKGHVKCPSCKTECVIQGLVKNSEIAAKENINSGLPLSVDSATLHRKLVSSLCDCAALPLDVFEKAEVVREERYCIPAYIFYCNGTASYTYDKGVDRTQTYTVDLGNRVETRDKTHTDWQPVSSNVSITKTIFAPGEKKMASDISLLCKGDDEKITRNLVDIEELEFPHDVVTYDYNLPQPVAFTDYVQPIVDDLLKEKAKNSLVGKVRNFSMGGANIQKEITRVFIGLYRIVYTYEGKEYDVRVLGDGSFYTYNRPVDEQRQKTIDEKKRAIASVPANNLKKMIIGVVIGAIGAVISFLIGLNAGLGGWIALGVFALLITLLSIKIPSVNKAGRERDEQRAKAKEELNEFENRLPNIVKQFKEQKKALRGIYEQECTGNSNAFPQ